MERPTKEQVDEDLASVHAFYGDEPEEREWRLAAEVRALREEARRDPVLRIRELLATIERVEAIGSGPGFCMGDDTLVKLGEVRAALRGES